MRLPLAATAWAFACLCAMRAEGFRYLWGGGGPSKSYPTDADCSGFVGGWAPAAGVWSHTAPRLRAIDMANGCDVVPPGQQCIGDLCFFGSGGAVSHVTAVVSPPDKTGHSWTIGANHGGSGSTPTSDPDGMIDRQAPGWWSSGFICYGRPKADFYPPNEGDILISATLQRMMEGGSAERENPNVVNYIRARYGGLL